MANLVQIPGNKGGECSLMGLEGAVVKEESVGGN